jgi:hypothetical protein
MISHAIAYASRGLQVLPIRLGDKRPLLEHGVLEASSDEATVRAWWSRWPAANIAIAIPKDWIVVDVDPRNGGDAELARLEAEHDSLPVTVTARTGGGGAHYIYQRPAAVALRGKLGPGIDLLGHGRYILVAPSIHPNGNRYEWTSPKGTAIAPAPAWLTAIARVVPAAPVRPPPIRDLSSARIERARRYVAATPPAISGSGGHTHTFLLAQRLVRGFGLDETTAYALMSVWNRTCEPPWSPKELAHKVKEAARAGRMDPGAMIEERRT